MKLALGALLGACVLATPAQAEFVVNYTTWKALSPGEKLGYAMGAYDEMLVAQDNKASMALTSAYRECGIELGLTSADVRDIIDRGYQDVSTWRHPPNIVLAIQMRKACLDHIARERAKAGL